MARRRIVEPVAKDGGLELNLPPECPDYLVHAIYKVNLSGGEMTLRLPNGQQALLSARTDLLPLLNLLDSEEIQQTLKDTLEEHG